MDSDFPTCEVLLIPDFGAGRLARESIQKLSELLMWRARQGKSTVIHVPSLEGLEKRHGEAVRALVKEKYEVLYGAATAKEKKAEMERARGLFIDLGLDADGVEGIIRGARSAAYAHARSGRRDLDFFTLRCFLDRSIRREALVQGCQAEGLEREAAEQLFDEEKARAESDDGVATFSSVRKALLARVERFTGRDATDGPLSRTINPLPSARSSEPTASGG